MSYPLYPIHSSNDSHFFLLMHETSHILTPSSAVQMFYNRLFLQNEKMPLLNNFLSMLGLDRTGHEFPFLKMPVVDLLKVPVHIMFPD